jgi:CSLREA domain-containing protein
MQNGLIKLVRGVSVALACAIPLLAPPAMSATINVTPNATDTLNGADGQCSLREAIQNINKAANAYLDCVPTGVYGTGNTINIPAGTYTTIIAGANEDFGASGDYDILRNVSIVGAGAGVTIINGNGGVINDRVFHIPGAKTVSISGVTITGGNMVGGAGGCISNSGALTINNSTIGGNAAGTSGGGIYNIGALTIANSTISGNTAATSGGGGVFNIGGPLAIASSTISGNTATASNGGGINNWTTASIANSTISGNTASLDGGGIYDKNIITVANSTISGNSASSGAGGVSKTGGGVSAFSSTIVAGQTLGADCSSASLTSNGYNLDSDSTCGFNQATDKHINPLLGALADNGGPTLTMSLLTGSPAIDAGPATCAAAPVNGVDQRGLVRPQGAGCDIGAYEGGLPNHLVTATTGTGGTVAPTNQVVISGSTASFTVTANTGYTAVQTVGGTCAAGSWKGAVYTTGAVTAACSASFTFTGPPTVTTMATTDIEQAGATLNGTVDPKNASTTVTFAYGLAKTYGSTVSGGALTGGTPQPVSAQVTGLACGTAYYYRAVAVNQAGTTNGSGLTFTTSECLAPSAVTGEAKNIMQAGATLKGKVDPNKASTTVTFEYGLTNAYGSTISGGVLAGGSLQAVSASLTGLMCDKTYYYRAMAVNSNGPANGAERAFRTSACLVPDVTTLVAKNISQAGATLNGKVDPKGAPSTATFDYGLTEAYGSTVSAGTPTGDRPRAVSATLKGLPCGTTYHFRAVAVNANGGVIGADRAFRTSACMPPIVTTELATSIGSSMATLGGKVNPNKVLATVTFEYGLDKYYGSTVSAGTLTGDTPQVVSAQVLGLACSATYHFRIVAVNSNVPLPANGVDRVFKTAACPVYDFAGDGKSDILLRDAVTGQTAIWMMNGVTVTSNTATSLNAGAYTSAIGLQAQGVGDFDGDNKYDVLWRDAVTGQLSLWTMNGAAVVTSAALSVHPGVYTSTTGLQVQGIGDFDGDGKSDILFRDAVTGQTSIWFMNGTTVTKSKTTNVHAGAYTSTTGLQVQGIGDFNGDGKSDILFRDAVTGQTSIWFMNGAAKTGGGYTILHPGLYTSTTGWQIQGVGDFNGDRKSDILFRDAQTGQTSIWFMNGTAKTGGGYTILQPGLYTSTTGWQIHGVGDFDGDGKSDILLRYAGTGETFIWLMNGVVVTGDWTSIPAGAYTPTTGLQIISGKP